MHSKLAEIYDVLLLPGRFDRLIRQLVLPNVIGGSPETGLGVRRRRQHQARRVAGARHLASPDPPCSAGLGRGDIPYRPSACLSPWTLPVLGHIHYHAGDLPHCALRDLARRHGPLVHHRLGGLPMVVASYSDVARDVMVSRDGGSQACVLGSREQILASSVSKTTCERLPPPLRARPLCVSV